MSRVINQESLQRFRALIDLESWEDVYEATNANLAYNAFLKKFSRCYNAAFPLQEYEARSKKIKKPWITRELYKRITQKNKKYHEFIRCKDTSVLVEFKKLRNQLNSDLRKAKNTYFENRFMNVQNDSRKVWDIVNEVMGRKRHKQDIIDIYKDGVRVPVTEVAEEMNRHFITIGSCEEARDEICSLVSEQQLESIMLVPTTPTEIYNIIQSLSNSVAAGVDGIKVPPIKYVANTLSLILSDIINKMLQSGEFP
uniref:Putative tick transposon n=1 Tax=Amblyomma sculptum TaxID=1581419 RepID=A0A1E1XP74_AMBSC